MALHPASGFSEELARQQPVPRRPAPAEYSPALITFSSPMTISQTGTGYSEEAEHLRIQAILGPALARVQNLRNTLNVRVAASVSEERARLDNQNATRKGALLIELDSRAALEQKARDKQFGRAIQLLQLRELALTSELDYLREVTLGQTANATVRRRATQATLNDVRTAIAGQEASLQAANASAAERLLVAKRTAVALAESEATANLVAFQKHERSLVDAKVGEQETEVREVLALLEPLGAAPQPPPTALRMAALAAPALQLPLQGAPTPRFWSTLAIPSQMAFQKYVASDVTERVTQLAAQRGWRLVTTRMPHVPDKTVEVARVLLAQWNP